MKLHAEKSKKGVVTVSEAGFKLQANPDKVHAPDVAYISKEITYPVADIFKIGVE